MRLPKFAVSRAFRPQPSRSHTKRRADGDDVARERSTQDRLVQAQTGALRIEGAIAAASIRLALTGSSCLREGPPWVPSETAGRAPAHGALHDASRFVSFGVRELDGCK